MSRPRRNSATSSRASGAVDGGPVAAIPRDIPVVDLIVPASPGAALLVAAVLLGVPPLCLLAPSGPRVPALVSAVAAALAGIRPLRRDLLGKGPGAVRSLRWEADGRFIVGLADGLQDSCRLGRGSLSWGPATWLVLEGPRGRRTVFLDAARVDPASLAALRCRLWREGRRAAVIG